MSVYGNLFLLDGLEKNDKENIIRSLPDTVKFKKGELIYSRKCFFGALGFIVCGSVKAVTNNDRRLVMKELCGGAVSCRGGLRRRRYLCKHADRTKQIPRYALYRKAF